MKGVLFFLRSGFFSRLQSRQTSSDAIFRLMLVTGLFIGSTLNNGPSKRHCSSNLVKFPADVISLSFSHLLTA
jgi:hypothetical protein